jgi:hypothetical protein
MRCLMHFAITFWNMLNYTKLSLRDELIAIQSFSIVGAGQVAGLVTLNLRAIGL